MNNEEAAIQEMIAAKKLHGVWDSKKAGRPATYFRDRNIFLDCRGALSIHPETDWGWEVMVLTTSHKIGGGKFGGIELDRGVTVEKDAWICSRALLYNCTIGEGAIVACGAVVRNMTVEPHTIVEGNPARPIKKFVDGKWVRCESLP